MKKKILWIFALVAIFSGLTAFTSANKERVVYRQVQVAKADHQTANAIIGNIRFKRALHFLPGDRIKPKPGFKLYVHDTIIILLKDEEDKLSSKILGYDVDIVGTFGDYIIVAICECSEGSDDCQFEKDSRGDTICAGSACGDCRGGFEVWGPTGTIGQTVTPF